MKSVVIGLSLSLASLLAYADGPQYQYEQAAVNQAALDPNEAVVNDDGAIEDPNARMSGTARAYRNGYYNGKKAQREQDATVNLPPLPRGSYAAPRLVTEDDQSRYTSIPPQPVPSPAPRYYAPQRAQQYDPDYGYNERPVSPPVNVYVQPPVYAPRPEPVYTQPDPYYYAPPPGPPASTYVVVQGVPPTLATGYWPRPYYVRPQPPVVIHGWVRWH